MSDVSTWSTTANANNSASPNGFPENMPPSGVNDSCREVMAAVKRADTENAKLAGATYTGLVNLAAGADIASAATIDLTAATGNCPRITGTTSTSAVTMNTGQQMLVVADGAWPLIYNSTTNKLNTGVNYICAAGDMILYSKDLSGIIHGTIFRAKPEGYIYIRDERVAGTQGGDFPSGTRVKRALNTIVHDTGGNASLAANVITLTFGVYRFKAQAPANMVDYHQLRINFNSGAAYFYGASSHTSSTASIETMATVVGRFTIATATATIELEHSCQTTRTFNGLGVGASPDLEVFAQIELWKEV